MSSERNNQFPFSLNLKNSSNYKKKIKTFEYKITKKILCPYEKKIVTFQTKLIECKKPNIPKITPIS